MSYDMVLLGGTGAQFGHAVLESVAMGVLAPPRATYVVDADKGYYDDELVPAYERHVIEPARAAQSSTKSTAPEPRLEHVPPYGHAKQDFTIRDLLGIGSAPAALTGLAHLCLTDEESHASIQKGLYCMPKLGSIITGLNIGSGDANRFPNNLCNRLADVGGHAPIVLAGSVAGGTGAGFLTPLLQALRSDHRLNQRPIYAFVFLPWFSVAGANNQKAVGPTNQRMRRNASQGIRSLEGVLNLPDVKKARAETYGIVLGLPPGAKAPERASLTQISEPGPLLFYAVSMLSGNFEALENARVTHQLPSGIYAVRCNAREQNIPSFARRVLFSVQIVNRDGTQELKVPFEAFRELLVAQEKALRELLDPTRFQRAFGRLLDNSDYLPRILFDALKQGRTSTAERVAFGMDLVERLKLAANDLQGRRERLTANVASEGGTTVRFADLPPIDDWWDKNLKQMTHLDKLIRATPNIENRVKDAVAQGNKVRAADLVVEALFRGLASGRETRAALGLFVNQRAQSNRLALPADLPAIAAGDVPLVSLAGQVDDVATALVQDDTPNSQCIPSPLARAHVVEFLSTRAPGPSARLAGQSAGRVALALAGLSTGHLRIGERIFLGAGAHVTPRFDRTVVLQEKTDAQRPYRTDWISIITDPQGNPVAATSPQTGLFDSVRTDETDTDAILPQFVALEAVLNQDQTLTAARSAYSVLLDDITRQYPAAVEYSWHRLLSRFTHGVSPADSRATFGREWYYAVGPFPLQIDVDDNNHPRIAWTWLPRRCSIEHRSRAASILASVASTMGQQPVRVDSTASGQELRLLTMRTGAEVLVFRSFQGTLAPEDDFRSGALEVLRFDTDSVALTPLALQWKEAGARLGLRLSAQQKSPHPRLSAAEVLKAMSGVADFNKGLRIDDARLDLLGTYEAGPFAPGIVNLFAVLPWPA